MNYNLLKGLLSDYEKQVKSDLKEDDEKLSRRSKISN